MKVKIPFQPEFELPVLMGQKKCTSRTKRYGRAGDTFEVFGASFRLTGIYRMPLSGVLALYEAEGFKSPEAFIACWNRLHPRRKFQPDQKVWVHWFERISKGEGDE
jgi:hypothetical protein